MTMKRIALSVTPETEKRIENIPTGSRSQILRSLLRAYVTFQEEVGPAVALGVTLNEDIAIGVRIKEVEDATK